MASTAGDNGYGRFVLSGETWTYTLNQWAVQDLDAGDTVSDRISYTASDTSTRQVAVTITGTEDAPVITGTTGGVVTEDAASTATGSLAISDADASDNPISFVDQASTLGDNGYGYGHFVLAGGAWSCTLNNAHSKVQALDSGESLTDRIAFTATDGTAQTVTVSVHGATEASPPAVEYVPPPLPPPIAEDPEPPVDEEDPVDTPESEEEPVSEEDPGSSEKSPGDSEDDAPGPDVVLPFDPVNGISQPVVPNEIPLSVLADRDQAESGIETTKPTAEETRTFLQEFKTIWKEEAAAESVSELEPPKNGQFWSDVEIMLNDLDANAEKQEQQLKLTAEAAAGISLSLTAGFVSWALRAGSMAECFLAAMPTWRNIDPMPVLAAGDKEKVQETSAPDDDPDDTAEKQDEKIDSMFDHHH